MDAQSGVASQAVLERSLLLVDVPLSLTLVVDDIGGDRQFEAVILREGVFTPGLGNEDGSRIFFPREVLARMAPGGEGKPVNLEHKRTVLDEVGAMTQLRMDDEGVRLRANLILQQKRPRYLDALGFVEGRLKAGQVPNVSVELDRVVLRPATPDEAAFFDFALVDALLIGCAILPNGACSDQAGCGIGLASTTIPDGIQPQATTMRLLADARKSAFGGRITVLALQGIDNKETTTPMCDQKELVASLQAEKKALESAAQKHATDLAAAKAEVVSLTAQVAEFEKEEMAALTAAVAEAAPKGADVKALLGESPSKETLLVALKAWQAVPKPATAPAAPASPGFGMSGRHTQAVTRTPTGAKATTSASDLAAKQAALKARYAALGLKAPGEKDNKVPLSMQRNTARTALGLHLASEGAGSE